MYPACEANDDTHSTESFGVMASGSGVLSPPVTGSFYIFSSILLFNNLFLCVLNEFVPFPCIVRMFTVIARGTCNEMVEAYYRGSNTFRFERNA